MIFLDSASFFTQAIGGQTKGGLSNTINNQETHLFFFNMMMTRRCILGVCLFLAAHNLNAQIFLSGSSYHEDFNGLGGGLPAGWSVTTGATLSDPGLLEAFTPTPTSWGDSGGRFKNFASANNPGVDPGDSTATQAAYADRALGVRQTGSFGDPGAAFLAEIANTQGFQSFGMNLDMQILSHQGRSTTWTMDYRVGNSGPFIPLGQFEDPGGFGSATRHFDFGSALDNLSDSVFIRIAALDVATGSGSRDSFGIDNVSMNYSAVPEPEEYLIVAMGSLLLFAGYRRWRGQSAAESSQIGGGKANPA